MAAGLAGGAERVGRLVGKTALVTGASQGIGAATAKVFAREGADLVLHWYDGEEEINKVADECVAMGVSCRLVHSDFSTREGIEFLTTQIDRGETHRDVLVNNAYFPGDIKFPGSYDGWQRTLDVNLTAVAHLCFWALENMVNGGSVINITSIQSMFSGEYSWAYGATKSAIEQLTKRLVFEGGPKGIRANTVRPGLVITDRNRSRWYEDEPERLGFISDIYPLRRVGEPVDIANVCAFLASDESSFITGASIAADGGLSVVNAALGGWYAHELRLTGETGRQDGK
jgi:NAD(P)-dependent dehydrogenase (short-subunit alcohol dehydrogenase family)